MRAFGATIQTPRAFGSPFTRLRSGGVDVWVPGDGGGDYVHSVWGDTSKLTPPRRDGRAVPQTAP